jgi:hypothetical protein
MSPLIELKAAADASLLQHYARESLLCRDALQLFLTNGVSVEVRLASPEAYAFTWVYGDAMLRIDTAPIAHGVGTFPNHLHDADECVRADPVTQPGRGPIEHLAALVMALLADPLLASKGAEAP